jgi:large subunit ribosomal protein L1
MALVNLFGWLCSPAETYVQEENGNAAREEEDAEKILGYLPGRIRSRSCSQQDAEAAKAAGAAVVGAEDLVKAIQDGELAFDRCVATPEVMPLVSRVARVLGPRGLMPNPKMGTVTKDVGAAVKSAMAGQAQFKADRFGMVHVGVGKVTFEPEALLENIRVLMVALGNAKPEGAKGKYLKGVFLTSTMGKAVPVEVATVDPRSSRFMLEATLTT